MPTRTTRTIWTRLVRVVGVLVVAMGVATPASSSPLTADPRGPARSIREGRPVSPVPHPGPGRSSARATPPPRIPATITTVDADSFAGAENAIYAADRSNVYVAYKRFLRDPFDPGGDVVEAELRVAKSEDGGEHWDVQVLDGAAPEEGDLVQQSVAVDGDGADVVYVTYLVQNEHGNILRFARTGDGGDTWTRGRVTRFAGEYKAVKVIDADTALVATHRTRLGGSELALYLTTDGGQTWTSSKVYRGAGWYVGLDRGNGGRIWISFYHGGDTDLYTATAKGPAGPWTTKVIAGSGDDEFYTGLFSSLDLSLGEIFVASEDFQPSLGRSVVRLARSSDGGATWTKRAVDSSFAIGWNTTVHVLRSAGGAATDVYLTYWHELVKPPSTFRGHARIAHSTDGGDTWAVWTIPEPNSVHPDIDSAAPALDTQFVSYWVRDYDTNERTLRVARLDLSAA
jgi:hypothetical protein